MRSFFILLFVVVARVVGSVALGAVGTNAFDPGVALSTNEMNSLRSASTNSLSAFRARITPANRQLMGFDSDVEVVTATNGDPLLIFTMQMNQLTNYHAGDDLNLLLAPSPKPQPPVPSLPQPTPRAFIPIMVGTNVKSSTVLRLIRTAAGTAAAWGGTDWGHPNVIRNLIATCRAIPDTDLSPGTVRFAVEILIPRIWLVGYYNTNGELVLRSTINLQLGPVTINRHEVLTQPAVEGLAAEAQRYNLNLPN